MIEFIKKIFKKYREQIAYLFFGGLTTLVSIAVSSLFYYVIFGKTHNILSNVISEIVAITFAYITNKFCVFDSKVDTKKALIYEMVSFFGCRLLTLAIDEAIMIITVDKFGWNGLLMKIMANIVVIILNFVFSKLIIFKNGKKK